MVRVSSSFFHRGAPLARGRLTWRAATRCSAPHRSQFTGRRARRHANGRSGEIIPGAGAGRSATGAGDWRSPDGKGGTLAETDQQIAEEQRKTVKSNLHLSATAPMGNESDPIAVVDACGESFRYCRAVCRRCLAVPGRSLSGDQSGCDHGGRISRQPFSGA